MDFEVNEVGAGEARGLNQRHADMVAKLMKPGEDMLATITPEKADLWHAATGVAGEAGELLDAIKKHVAYNKPLDRENVKEELGDLEFYMEALRRNVGLTRDECLTHNINKLSTGKNARYADGYSDAAAQARADKTEPADAQKALPRGVPSLALSGGSVERYRAGDQVHVIDAAQWPVVADWFPGLLRGEHVNATILDSDGEFYDVRVEGVMGTVSFQDHCLGAGWL